MNLGQIKPYGNELFKLLPTLRLDRRYGMACIRLQLSRCRFNRIEQADMLGERCLFTHPLTGAGSKRMRVSIPWTRNSDGWKTR
jgi:hypothetical protein